MHDSILYRYTANILFSIVFESFNVYADAMLLINVMLLVTGFCRGKLPHNFKWYIFDSNFYRDKLSLFFKSSILEAWLIPTQVPPSSRYIKWYDYVSAIMSWYKLMNLTGAQLGLCQFDRGPLWSLSIWQEPSLVAVNLTGAQLGRDSQILLHLDEIWSLLTAITHLSLRSPMFGERRFGVLFGMLKFKLILEDFRRSAFGINLAMILSIPLNVRDEINDACFTKHRWA